MASQFDAIEFTPDAAQPQPRGQATRLADVNGQAVSVLGIDPACEPVMRRRLMDLGLTPGAIVTRELRGPFGGSSAYRVRGALVALRDEQARHIRICPTDPQKRVA